MMHLLRATDGFRKRNERNDYVWAIDHDGKLVGDITAHIYETQKRAELYIVIGDKTMWGKGLGKEACILVLDEIFRTSDLYYIDTYITPENTRSLSLALSLGFTTFGTQTGGTKVLRLIKKTWEIRNRRKLSPF
ncbi:MAG: GNAT family N-acetyltransferase [Caldisericia bacterium]